jgi:hypothetical protein
MGKKLVKIFLWRFDSSPCSTYFISCIATEESTERERERHTHTHTETERGEQRKHRKLGDGRSSRAQ